MLDTCKKTKVFCNKSQNFDKKRKKMTKST